MESLPWFQPRGEVAAGHSFLGVVLLMCSGRHESFSFPVKTNPVLLQFQCCTVHIFANLGTGDRTLHMVECPVPSNRENKGWNYQQVPMYDPHSVLSYLFDEIGLTIDPSEVRRYWAKASERGCPWAQQEPGDRIPVKIFGDDCVYDERLNKAYALVLSLPLWRPRSARNSRFLLWAQRSTQFQGFEGILPVLARMVWSFNLGVWPRASTERSPFCRLWDWWRLGLEQILLATLPALEQSHSMSIL